MTRRKDGSAFSIPQAADGVECLIPPRMQLLHLALSQVLEASQFDQHGI